MKMETYLDAQMAPFPWSILRYVVNDDKTQTFVALASTLDPKSGTSRSLCIRMHVRSRAARFALNDVFTSLTTISFFKCSILQYRGHGYRSGWTKAKTRATIKDRTARRNNR